MKDLEDRFGEVEKRVQALVADNALLKKRVAELEAELARTRIDSEELRNFQGKRVRIREKIERILHSLDAIGEKGAQRSQP